MKNDSQPARPITEEQSFLSAYDAARFPHPSVTVDVALVTADGGRLGGVVAPREEHPHKGKWSLPGGFVRMEESLDEAAARVLKAKVGIDDIFLEQLYTFGQPDRDPRTRVITVAYYALVDAARLQFLAADSSLSGAAKKNRHPSSRRSDSSETRLPNLRLATLRVPWKEEQGGPVLALDNDGSPLPLAFDHADILGLVVQRLRGKLDYAPIGFELLPRAFTLRQLQSIHETILGRQVNKDSFRRRLLASGLITPTGKLEQDVGHRPAELYRFGSKGRAPQKSSHPHTSRKE